jgi:hypothetical protein
MFIYASSVGCGGNQTIPAELVSSIVFNEDEIIQNNGKAIIMVAPVRKIYSMVRLMICHAVLMVVS